MEPHLLHEFANDFYNEPIKLLICGYLRPEKNYPSLEALIEAIQTDIRLSDEKLDTLPYQVHSMIMKDLMVSIASNSSTQTMAM